MTKNNIRGILTTLYMEEKREFDFEYEIGE